MAGAITLLQGAYRQPISLTTQILSGVDAEPAVPAEAGWADQLRLSLTLSTDAPIVVDNNYGRFEATGLLRVLGTPAAPAITGRVTVPDGGRVLLAGHSWQVERATIDFTSATSIEPTLDISLPIDFDATVSIQPGRARVVAERGWIRVQRPGDATPRIVGPGRPLAATRDGRFIAAIAPARVMREYENPTILVVYQVN